VLGDEGLEVATAPPQPVGLIADGPQGRVLAAAVTAPGHGECVVPARHEIVQLGARRVELLTQMLHRTMVLAGPAEPAYLAGVLRLTGLPAPARYPRATVYGRGDRIELVFSGGDGGTTSIPIDPRLIGPIDDLEMVLLDLLAKLQALGYDARLGQARAATDLP
jgi:hypothetical protein